MRTSSLQTAEAMLARIALAALLLLWPILSGLVMAGPPPPQARCAGGTPNGVIDDGEQCDDGDTDDADYCLSNCRYAACGDAVVCIAPDCAFAPGLSGPESCDDGRSNDAASCAGECSRVETIVKTSPATDTPLRHATAR